MNTRIYTSHRRHDETKLMIVVNGAGERFSSIGELSAWLRPEDLVVMNDSATLPSSFWSIGDTPIELRLAAYAGEDLTSLREWWTIAFGAGDWRFSTEERGLPPELSVGERISFSPSLSVQIIDRHLVEKRLIKVRFEGENFLKEIYRVGRAIQYSYHRKALQVWDVQTPLARVPISVEPPSALLPFTWNRLLQLGSSTAYITHGAGLSSSGSESLDRLLPLAEYFEIPARTVQAIENTKRLGGRVIAVGTTVARALESYARTGAMRGMTSLRLSQSEPVKLVDGLLTGFHEPETSHFKLEEALLPAKQLESSFMRAKELGFLGHEFGDAVLLLKSR